MNYTRLGAAESSIAVIVPFEGAVVYGPCLHLFDAGPHAVIRRACNPM